MLVTTQCSTHHEQENRDRGLYRGLRDKGTIRPGDKGRDYDRDLGGSSHIL